MLQSFEDRFGAAPDISTWLYADVWLRDERVRRGPFGIPQQPFLYKRPAIGEPGLYLPLSLSWGIIGTPISAACTGSNNVPATSYGDTSGADLIAMYIGQYGAASALAVPHDSKNADGNWVGLTAVDSGGGNRAYGRWWYLQTPTGGTSHTFGTITGSGAFCANAVYALSGSIGASPFDVENHNSTGGATTLTTGTVTPSSTAYAALAGLTFTAASVPTIGSSFSLGPTTNFSGGANDGVAVAHKLGSLSGTETPQWTFASAEAAAAIAVFKVSAGSSSPTVGFETILRQASKRASYY